MKDGITPKEIQKKALKLWNSGRVLHSFLEKETLFPWEIKFRKPNAQEQLDHFPEIRQWIIALKKHSKESGIVSYAIEYKISKHRLLGEQQIPARILFENQKDFLHSICKLTEFDALLKAYQQSCVKYPVLHDWIVAKPRLFMRHQKNWHKLLNVCHYFMQNPRPNCYIRELEITSIDSKFIEKNTAILSELFELILPSESINQSIDGLKKHGFERRFGLKYDEPVIRLRLLDKSLQPSPVLSDLSLPLSQLSNWDVNCWRVFITENKINGLAFPDVQDSLVIFGLGYGVDSLAKIPWLSNCEIYYWGDIDTHGLSILSRLRRYFPKAKALMMDKETLQQHQSLCVEEPLKARCNNQLNYLSKDEQALYVDLQRSNQRLEQERIPMSYIESRVKYC